MLYVYLPKTAPSFNFYKDCPYVNVERALLKWVDFKFGVLNRFGISFNAHFLAIEMDTDKFKY